MMWLHYFEVSLLWLAVVFCGICVLGSFLLVADKNEKNNQEKHVLYSVVWAILLCAALAGLRSI